MMNLFEIYEQQFGIDHDEEREVFADGRSVRRLPVTAANVININQKTLDQIIRAATNIKKQIKAQSDPQILVQGLAEMKVDDEQWQNQTLQLLKYPDSTTSDNGIIGAFRWPLCRNPLIMRELRVTDSRQAYFDREEGWKMKFGNLYDTETNKFATLTFMNYKQMDGAMDGLQSFYKLGILWYRPVDISDFTMVWEGDAVLRFDATRVNKLQPVVQPHHSKMERRVQLWAAEDKRLLIRWIRTQKSEFSPVMYTNLWVQTDSAFFSKNTFGEWQVKIEGLHDQHNRGEGALFLKCVDTDNLNALYSALSQFGIKEVVMNDKVDRREGGKLLWSAVVEREYKDDKPMEAQVWKYSADSSIGIGEIGVLELRAALMSSFYGKYFNVTKRERDALTFANLNGVRFRKSDKRGIKMENFNVVQEVFEGYVSDVEWTTQKLQTVLNDHGVTRADEDRPTDICSVIEGPYGIDAFCAALVEAGAVDVTDESMFDF